MTFMLHTASAVGAAPTGLLAAAASPLADVRVEVVHRLEQPDRIALQGVLDV